MATLRWGRMLIMQNTVISEITCLSSQDNPGLSSSLSIPDTAFNVSSISCRSLMDAADASMMIADLHVDIRARRDKNWCSPWIGIIHVNLRFHTAGGVWNLGLTIENLQPGTSVRLLPGVCHIMFICLIYAGALIHFLKIYSPCVVLQRKSAKLKNDWNDKYNYSDFCLYKINMDGQSGSNFQQFDVWSLTTLLNLSGVS